ncbi:MAG: hypothetical protein Ct9H300mP22_6030 [Gammaproteobacteria bacterium]|nr:MAG: hypothetical protein Ct9H300mP22_6030 [Gammaproteobacteria bacterium]
MERVTWPPISYAVDGKQFVAVFAPSGTQAAAQHAGQLGLSALTGVSNIGHTLFVFALGGINRHTRRSDTHEPWSYS